MAMKAAFASLVLSLLGGLTHAASQKVLFGPTGSDSFGTQVVVLPNGSFIVTDPDYDQPSPSIINVGAVYLYNLDGILISRLTGSTADDRVGNSGITILSNGNFVIVSPSWAGNTGAATWGNSNTGFIGGASVVVSSANSLVGSAAGHSVGLNGITPLPNGHYLVRSQNWDNGAAADAGAVTWCDGFTGGTGVVSAANSLVGTQTSDRVGNAGISLLTNGNYLVRSFQWNNGGIVDAGAVTWANGNTGISGAVSSANSLVGSSTNDFVGNVVTVLTNGHFVARILDWDNGGTSNAGAVTWGNGTTGISGTITPANSLVGITVAEGVGSGGVVPLANGHYVVCTPNFDSGAATNTGAATWCDGFTGRTGTLSSANSLTGTLSNDQVSNRGALPLTNGHYVVLSSQWTATGPLQAGAATWCDGTTGRTGLVSPDNSLVGGTADDEISGGINIALPNGNYVITSLNWSNGSAANAGAVTWGNGKTGTKGTVSPANSLVGKTLNDRVGLNGIGVLANGNYVVLSRDWSNGPATGAGAVTWGNGKTGVKGLVSPANSLVGSTANDSAGWSFAALPNGHYVVGSKFWNNGPINDAGAATWCSGTTGRKGTISAANSFIGTHASDEIGDGVVPLTNGNYVVRSQIWNGGRGAATWGNGTTGSKGEVSADNSLVGNIPGDNVGSGVGSLFNGCYLVTSSLWDQPLPATANVGARTLGDGVTGTVGVITPSNSVLGINSGSGSLLSAAFDPIRNQLIVGDPGSNRVTFLGNHLRSLAKSGQQAPGTTDIAWSTPAAVAINDDAGFLYDSPLTGAGSTSGRNRAVFGAPGDLFPVSLIMQHGDVLDALGTGLPPGSKSASLSNPLANQPFLSLFQTTAGGQRLLLLDDGVSVRHLFRTGQPVAPLGSAQLSKFTDVLQSHNDNLVTLNYVLKTGTGSPAVTTGTDTGLLLLNHGGTVLNSIVREGTDSALFGLSGTIGQLSNKVSGAQAGFTHFISAQKPASGPAVNFVGFMANNATAFANNGISGQPAPTTGQNYSSFQSITGVGSTAYYKATLTGPANLNESLWKNTGLHLREGDDLTPSVPSGVKFAKFIRIWACSSAGDQLLIHAQLTGTGVTASNNTALILRQGDNQNLVLVRTGSPLPGTGAAKVKTLAAIDVHPRFGRYAVLVTLTGTSSATNQALLTGDTLAGNDTTLQSQRLPLIRLRKGERYSTAATPLGTIKSISLKPAPEPTGAGSRGQAQVINGFGETAVHLTTDRSLTELVLLPEG